MIKSIVNRLMSLNCCCSVVNVHWMSHWSHGNLQPATTYKTQHKNSQQQHHQTAAHSKSKQWNCYYHHNIFHLRDKSSQNWSLVGRGSVCIPIIFIIWTWLTSYLPMMRLWTFYLGKYNSSSIAIISAVIWFDSICGDIYLSHKNILIIKYLQLQLKICNWL